MRLSPLVLAVATLALAACGPSVNQKTKSAVDAWRAKVSQSTETYPAEKDPIRPRWEVGHWTQFLETDKDGNPSQVTYKILEKEGDAYWLENERLDYAGHSITKMLVSVPDWKHPETMSIRRVISKQNDEPATELPPFLLDMFAKPLLSGLRYTLVEGPREDVAVPAGKFLGAVRIDSKSQTPFGSFESETWMHGAVPVAGYVKMRSDDGKYTSELVDFGKEGAKSAITEPVKPAYAP